MHLQLHLGFVRWHDEAVETDSMGVGSLGGMVIVCCYGRN